MDDLFAPSELDPELVAYLHQAESMTMLRHPLVYSVPYFPQLNSYLNQQLAQKRTAIEAAITEHNWSHFIWMHERPYRVNALPKIADRMTDAEYWEQFSHIWTDTENRWQWGDKLTRQLFARPQPELLMTKRERDRLDQLPEPITIYRGIQLDHQPSRQKGWSWTLSQDKAEWFARRWLAAGARPLLLQAQVQRCQILAYLTSRGEEEIVIDPRHLPQLITHDLSLVTSPLDSSELTIS